MSANKEAAPVQQPEIKKGGGEAMYFVDGKKVDKATFEMYNKKYLQAKERR